MLFPTQPVNITLQSMSRPLSSLLVFLPKFYRLFWTLLLMLYTPHSFSPLVFKCTVLPIIEMTRFSQSIRTCNWILEVSDNGILQSDVFSLFCLLNHIQRDTHFRNWISSCPHARGWKGTYSVKSDRKSYSLSMNNEQLPTSTHLPRFNICHLEMNKIIQITIKSCSFRFSWEFP
jgi:hypothetical protein